MKPKLCLELTFASQEQVDNLDFKTVNQALGGKVTCFDHHGETFDELESLEKFLHKLFDDYDLHWLMNEADKTEFEYARRAFSLALNRVIYHGWIPYEEPFDEEMKEATKM